MYAETKLFGLLIWGFIVACLGAVAALNLGYGLLWVFGFYVLGGNLGMMIYVVLSYSSPRDLQP